MRPFSFTKKYLLSRQSTEKPDSKDYHRNANIYVLLIFGTVNLD